MPPPAVPQNLVEVDLSFARSERWSHGRRRRRGRRRLSKRIPVRWLAPAVLLVLPVPALIPQLRGDTGPPPGAAAREVAAKPPAGSLGCPIPAGFRREFDAAARRTGVPLPLLAAMAYEESGMDPYAISNAGARGLLQVMPATARELELNPDRVRTNVLAGARYMRRMLERFERLDLALAAYNAGPATVTGSASALGPQTFSYVTAVRARTARLAACR